MRAVPRHGAWAVIALVAFASVGATPLARAADPVQCAPRSQSIQFGQLSDISASGGDGVYRWDARPGAVLEDAVAGFATFSWTTSGAKTIVVTSAGSTDICTVTVVPAGGTAPAAFSVAKEVRNPSAGHTIFASTTRVRSNEIIEAAIRIVAPDGVSSGPFRIVDELPQGLSYVPGSAVVDGGASIEPRIVGTRLAFEPVVVPSGGSAILRYRAVMDRPDLVAAGSRSVLAFAEVLDSVSGHIERTVGVTLILFGPALSPIPNGGVGAAGQVATGPGDAVIFATMLAIATSLLYASYARSRVGRSREAAALGRDRSPLDFRS